MAEKRMSLKLLIHKKRQRVLFAEGGKDFIDFLFTILTLPLGTVVKLLTKSSMVGSLGKLYDSVEGLNQNYMQTSQAKDDLLSPKTLHLNFKTPFLQSLSDEFSALALYKCSKDCSQHVSWSNEAICPVHNRRMSAAMTYVPPPTGTGVADRTATGYVKEIVTYMITDDLEVKPMSTISGINLLNLFNVVEIGDVEEKVVDIGMDEALRVLRASLQSNTVLTDVFLRQKKEK